MNELLKVLESKEQVNIFITAATGGNFGIDLKMQNCDVTIEEQSLKIEDDNEQMIIIRLDSSAEIVEDNMWRIKSGGDEVVISFF